VEKPIETEYFEKEYDDKIRMQLFMLVFKLLSNEQALRVSKSWQPRLI